MRPSRPLVLATAAWLGLAALVVSPTGAQGPRDRTLFVSAVDKTGAPVEGLGPDAFIVREDGARREVLRVSRATEPMDIVLLVDNSAAAADEIMFMRPALSTFVKKMALGNHIAVITLADRPTIRTDYTDDAAKLSESVGSIFSSPQSGMTLLDALTEVGRGLARREATRAVVVPVITDGPEFTNTYHQDVIRTIRNAGAAVHAMTLGQFRYDDDRSMRERVLFLNGGPEASGGQRVTLLSPTGLAPALDKLAAELKAQYKVVYARPQSLIQPEKLAISSARADVVMRGAPARGGNGD